MNYKQALVILGLTEGFTEDELKKKYRELSMKWHPDKGGSEEMMKQVNVAYETLKVEQQKETSNEQSNQYYEFKRKLEVYRSKKNYIPGTLEHKYAEAINEVINNFYIPYNLFFMPETLYNLCFMEINDLFLDYKEKVCRDIPKSFLEKYSNINEMCPFDEYVQRVEKIKNEYKKIETTLDYVIDSIDKLLSNEVYEKILEAKNIILKEVIDGKIGLRDSVYELRSLILQIIATQDELQKSDNDKLYITRDGKGKPEFIFKESEDGDFVNFYKISSFFVSSTIRTNIETDTINRKEFNNKYMSLNEYLAQAKFINKCVFNGMFCINVQLYSLGNIAIYLNGWDDRWFVGVGHVNEIPTADNCYAEKYGVKYKNKQVLIEEIYQSFKELIEPLHKEKHTKTRTKYDEQKYYNIKEEYNIKKEYNIKDNTK